MNIKTWAERAESLSDDTVVTSLHLAQFKQDEIDELRAENARMRDALNECVREGDGESTCEQSYLRPVVLMRARAALGES